MSDGCCDNSLDCQMYVLRGDCDVSISLRRVAGTVVVREVSFQVYPKMMLSMCRLSCNLCDPDQYSSNWQQSSSADSECSLDSRNLP